MTGLLESGGWLRYKGGRLWHRIGSSSSIGDFYALHTLCGAAGEEIAEVDIRQPATPCGRCRTIDLDRAPAASGPKEGA